MSVVHFLEASVPLTKSYSRAADGSVTKTPYPFVWDFTSHDEHVKSLSDLHAAITKHAALGHCMLKGKLARPLVSESRAGSTLTQDDTDIVVLDLDGLPADHEGVIVTVDRFLEALGLQGVSYILQWSASYAISDNSLRAHIFMMLDRAYSAPLLKQWLIQLNHQTPMLRAAMSLTKTGNAISWPLDVSACQNDKLIYIAPPKLRGIKDPLPRGKRIELVKRKKDRLTLGSAINATDKNRNLTHKRIDELREAAGLPKRKITYKTHGSMEVMVKPDSAVITEMKTERGFVYFNLNGGDSWAYYHPENNPDYVFNFKGEPVYLTKELLPEYWAQISTQPKVSSAGDLYLAFCDRSTSTYWRGTYNAGTNKLRLDAAKNETQVRHFCKQYGVPIGDYVPEWDMTFDPHSDVRVDPQALTVNTFCPTPYMLVPPKQVLAVPKTIDKVIRHVLGGKDEIVDHFLNWLAFIVQYRDRTGTAWVLHGTQGTGKGILMSRILRPLLGDAPQTTSRRMEELNEPYNHWMKSALLVFVDEVQTTALRNERGVMAKLKNFITEITISIRQMYAGAYEARNYTNWIFASNKPDPVSIDMEDRRFNVGAYQSNRLSITPQEIERIDRELQAFYDFLSTYPVSETAAHTVLHTEDRETMQSISEASVDTVANAVLNGNFGFFVEQLPTNDAYKLDTRAETKANGYISVLQTLMRRTNPDDGRCSVSRDELRTLFEYTVGGMPESPNKFVSRLKHHRIHITRVWGDDKTVAGIKVTWTDRAQWGEFQKALFPQTAKPAKPKKTKA